MQRRTIAVAVAGLVAVGGSATAALAVSGGDDRSAALAKSIDPAKPKNVILLVGDGMGESEVSIARAYQGVDRPLNMDRLPFRGVATTYDLTPLDDVAAQGKQNFAPDSASTATAWSTGHKTMINRIGQGNSANRETPGENVETTIEAAKKLGKWTGNVTTAEVTDATPAGPTAHISQRGCQGPADTRSACASEAKVRTDGTVNAGALGSIAEQQVALRPDLTFGAGRARFEQKLTAAGSESVADLAVEQGFRYITTKTELDAIDTLGDEPGGKPVLGLFHDKEVDGNAANMVTEWKGDVAKPAAADGNPVVCDTSHRATNAPEEPSLSAMSAKAIDLLDESSGDQGFFLQVEGASIDKRDHAANPCEQIGETLEFDKAIGNALDYQQSHPDTLVIVTADHSHTSQIVNANSTASATKGNETPTGYYSTLKTPSGDKLRIAYGTAGGRIGTTVDPAVPSQQHTGAAVPVMAVGPQAANVTGTIDHTDLFPLLSFQRTPSTLPSGTTTVPGPTTTVAGPTTTVAGPTVAVPGPATTVPGAPKPVALSVGVAVPRTLSVAAARKGLPVSLVASKASKVSVTVKRGNKTVAKRTVKLGANRAKAATIKATKLSRGKSASLTVAVKATAGKERASRSARVTATKR